MTYQEAVDKHGSVRKAAKALGIPRTTLQRKLKQEKRDGVSTEALEPVGEAGQSGVRGLQPAPVDAFTAQCDLLGLNPSEVTRGWLRTEAGTIQVDRKKSAKSMELSADFVAILEQARKHVVREAECRSADSMLVVSLHDAHFGRLSFFREAGHNYDPAIAAAVYKQAVSDALAFFGQPRITKIVFPIGSDLLHTDNLASTTTAGTRVDSVDTRLHKVFDVAVAAVISAIEDCLLVADVDVVWIPGNHDELLGGMLAKVIKTYFRFDSRVKVDDREQSRKIIHWNTNLILFSHRFPKPQDAPRLLATEYPVEWGATTSREVHHGHHHTMRGTWYGPYQEVSGVMVRSCPSLASNDKWHYDSAYSGNCRAAESFLYSAESGFIGSHLAKVHPSDQ